MGWKPKSVHVVSFSPVSRVTYHNLWRWQLVEHPAGAERTGSTRLQLCDLLALLPIVLLRFHLGMGDRFVCMGNGFLLGCEWTYASASNIAYALLSRKPTI